MRRGMVGLLVLLCAWAVPAAAQRGGDLVYSMSEDQLKGFLSWINREGDAVDEDQGDPGFVFMVKEMPVVVYATDGGKTLQLMAFIKDARPSDEQINAFNMAKRFARVYRSQEGNELWIQQDIDLSSGVTRNNVREQFKLFDSLLGDFQETFE